MSFNRRVVLIDCNDSFTYNIQQLIRKSGVRKLEIIPVRQLIPEQHTGAGRIILSPGPGLPDEYPEIFALLRLLLKQGRSIPVLGICLGHQILSVFSGGSVYNLDKVIHGQPAGIRIKADDQLLKGIPPEFTAGLYHSWAVEKPLPDELEVTAESESEIIMGMRHRSLPWRGLQFHPESFISEYGVEIMMNFFDEWRIDE